MLAHLSFSADSQTGYQSSNVSRLLQPICTRREPVFISQFFIACFVLCLTPLVAGEFSVETDVFIGKQAEPEEQRVTVFFNGKVVDFSRGGATEAYVLDTTLDELTIIDETSRKTSKVAANELVRFAVDQQARIAKMPLQLRNRLMPFLRVTWDIDEKTLQLAADGFSYSAKVHLASESKPDGGRADEVPVSPETVLAYRKFTDRIARYNAMRPQAMPPQSRLKLNAELAKINAVPSEITRTSPNGTARSTHRYSALVNKDRTRVREILAAIPQYQSLELRDFLNR